MKRRTFLKCLLGGSALVAAPGLLALVKSDAQRQDDIWALLKRKMTEAEARMIRDFSTILYGDGTVGDENFGLKALLSRQEQPDVILIGKNAQYEWHRVVADITFTGAG